MTGEVGSASKSLAKFLVAVTVWIASLLSITLFQIDLGFGLQLAMEISMDKLFDLTGVVKLTVLWCLGGAPIHAVTVWEWWSATSRLHRRGGSNPPHHTSSATTKGEVVKAMIADLALV